MGHMYIVVSGFCISEPQGRIFKSNILLTDVSLLWISVYSFNPSCIF